MVCQFALVLSKKHILDFFFSVEARTKRPASIRMIKIMWLISGVKKFFSFQLALTNLKMAFQIWNDT
ncbi:hypothetical protein V473_14825 [Sphingobium cupriresistens LL01]|uniref:Uncharacterized protein n=1 Tax=Sphingobium cupriresistens LL01 TaxID=1420583 RepID=A0A0J7XS45_9SPHN|nr:hypothetical protein V473_14825 [Sphingobium cupriresistens LL01]